MSGAWQTVMVIRSPQDQADFERLRSVLTTSLGLDWQGAYGEPDGPEVANDCAEDLWAAGFRLTSTTHRPEESPDE